jgi:glycosylphosphatidylinositol transamidase (GPIT) subunit GPI8
VRGELKIDDKTSINLDNDAVKLGNFKGSLVQNSDDSVILSGTATSIDIKGEDVTVNIK